MKIASQGGLAVVTGAAGGLGASFAKKLAERGYRLLLVDRRPEELKQVCQSLAAQHGVSAVPCVIDLCKRKQVERLAKRLEQMADVELLVNNAGFGTADYFVDTDASYLVGMVDVHVVAPTILTQAVLPGMIDRNRGGIINVSSLSSLVPQRRQRSIRFDKKLPRRFLPVASAGTSRNERSRPGLVPGIYPHGISCCGQHAGI